MPLDFIIISQKRAAVNSFTLFFSFIQLNIYSNFEYRSQDIVIKGHLRYTVRADYVVLFQREAFQLCYAEDLFGRADITLGGGGEIVRVVMAEYELLTGRAQLQKLDKNTRVKDNPRF